MGGTKSGGKKVAQTNYKRYGADYYKKIGAKGGAAKVPKGFAKRPDLARLGGKSRKLEKYV